MEMTKPETSRLEEEWSKLDLADMVKESGR